MPTRKADTPSPLISATRGSGPRVSFVGRNPEASFLPSMSGFAGGVTGFLGANPEAVLLNDGTDGLMRLGPDPRAGRAQADAQAQNDNETSQAELHAIVEAATKREQAERTAAALIQSQAHGQAGAQEAFMGGSGSPRRPAPTMVHPRAAGLLARLSAQARTIQGLR